MQKINEKSKKCEKVAHMEKYIEQNKNDDKLIRQNKPTEHDILDLCDQNGFAFEMWLSNDAAADEPDICLEIRGADEHSNMVGRAYGIYEYTASEIYEDFSMLVQRWLKEPFVEDSNGKLCHDPLMVDWFV